MNETELDEMLDLIATPAPPPSLRRGLVSALPVPRRKVLGIPLRWALAAGAIALCGLVGAAAFNISPVHSEFSAAVERPDGPFYARVTRLMDPPIANLKWWFLGGENSFGGTLEAMHGDGYVRNRFAGTFAGYRYNLNQVAEGEYRVTFSPLDVATIQKGMAPFKMNGQVVPTPALPDPTIVHMDEPFEVTLYANGGERIYDRIVVSRTAQHRTPYVPPNPATVLHLVGPQLYINGELALSKNDIGSGPVVWVHLPGQGRFLAALDAAHNPLFVGSGHVNGNVLEFQSGNTQFRIVCSQPITTGGDRPLFVFHQQSFEDLLDPADPRSQKPIMNIAGPAWLHHETIP